MRPRAGVRRLSERVLGNEHMLTIIARAVLALQGATALFVAANVWLDPVRVGAQLGLSPLSDLGLATMRGDLGTLFASSGIFMLAAAALTDRRLIVPPLVFTSVGLAGRTLSLALTTYAPDLIQPMIVEAVTIALLVGAYVMLANESSPAPTAPKA
jgi:hypothetical protein